jgi:formylglycine-generating enzyme required for sulfatase activity
MGSPRWEVADELPHRVRITRPFYLGVHEVTVAQFRRFVEETEYRTDADKDPRCVASVPWQEMFGSRPAKPSWRNPGFDQADDHPVVMVSWRDAMALCQWLSSKEGQAYRLPTEAEWEYACRAGTATRYWSGENDWTLCSAANVCGRTYPFDAASVSWDDGYAFTSPSGSFASNAFGLFDMHGNVWEWCSDWYDREYYRKSPGKDPQGPSSGDCRVIRGGSFGSFPVCARSANRGSYDPHVAMPENGFRVAMSYGRP